MNKKFKSEDDVKENPQPNFTATALGIHPVMTDQGVKYVLVELKYDPVSLVGSEGKVLKQDIREDIIDHFKNAVVEKGLFG